MINFLESMAYRQYENKLPERYEEKPLFKCKCCKWDIFIGELYYIVAGDYYCSDCVEEHIAEREDF